MITGIQTVNPTTGIRTTSRFGVGRAGASHGHWAVHESRDGWCLQWGYRQELGTRFERPWPNHRGFRTRKDAEAVKRELRAAGVEGWNGPPAAPEVP